MENSSVKIEALHEKHPLTTEKYILIYLGTVFSTHKCNGQSKRLSRYIAENITCKERIIEGFGKRTKGILCGLIDDA